jgi:hypothetical protein
MHGTHSNSQSKNEDPKFLAMSQDLTVGLADSKCPHIDFHDSNHHLTKHLSIQEACNLEDAERISIAPGFLCFQARAPSERVLPVFDVVHRSFGEKLAKVGPF